MTDDLVETARSEQPLAWLERRLMGAYVAGAGYDLHDLLVRTDDEARRILSDASLFATRTLSEIEARSHYLSALSGAV